MFANCDTSRISHPIAPYRETLLKTLREEKLRADNCLLFIHCFVVFEHTALFNVSILRSCRTSSRLFYVKLLSQEMEFYLSGSFALPLTNE